MSDAKWVMFRCRSCNRCSGARKGQKTMTCSHCGVTDNYSIVKEFDNSQLMSQEIQIENTPIEIRAEIENALSVRPDPFSPKSVETLDPLFLFTSTADKNGIIDVDELVEKLNSYGLSFNESKNQLEQWIMQSEIEGMIIRLSSEKLQLLS
jgi:hypothetical protein